MDSDFPNKINLNVTNACDSFCTHCDMWMNKNPVFLSLESIKSLFDEIADYTDQVEVLVNGGEPMLHPSFFEIVDYAHTKNIFLYITTNGLGLDSKKARRLASYSNIGISISMEGGRESHKTIRGYDNYEVLLSLLSYIRKINSTFSLGINTVIMEETIDTIPQLVNYCIENNISINFQAIVEELGGSSSDKRERWIGETKHWPKSLAKVNCLLEYLKKQKEYYPTIINNPSQQLDFWKIYFKNPFLLLVENCRVGDTFLEILCEGDVLFCNSMEKVGNLYENSLKEIWNSEKAQEVRRKIYKCKKSCHFALNCQFEECQIIE